MEMMNRLVKGFALGVGLIGWVVACQPPDELPVIPKISFNRAEFYPIDGNVTDSLILYVNFEDGDGDLGLRSNEDTYPYHPFNFVIDSKRSFVMIGKTDNEPPFYSIPLDNRFRPLEPEKLYSETDNRRPFNCQDYEIIEYFPNADAVQTEVDTFLIQKNPNNKNIYVDFFRKVNGDYEFLDWAKAFSSTGCGTDFNARFPIFDSDNLGKSLTGTLRYSMLSEGFGIILRQDTFKLRVYIKDRALHDSNVIESPDLTLNNIRVN